MGNKSSASRTPPRTSTATRSTTSLQNFNARTSTLHSRTSVSPTNFQVTPSTTSSQTFDARMSTLHSRTSASPTNSQVTPSTTSSQSFDARTSTLHSRTSASPTNFQVTPSTTSSQSFDARTSTLRSQTSVSPQYSAVPCLEPIKVPAPPIPARPRVLPGQSNVSQTAQVLTSNGWQGAAPATANITRLAVVSKEQKSPETNTQTESKHPIPIQRTKKFVGRQWNQSVKSAVEIKTEVSIIEVTDTPLIIQEKRKIAIEMNNDQKGFIKNVNISKSKPEPETNINFKNNINEMGNSNLKNFMRVETIKPNNIVDNLIPNVSTQNIKESEAYQLKRLSSVSPDYQLVSILFRQYMLDSEIVKVERIHNQHTLALYSLKKAHLQSYRRDVEEILLFHGTNANEIHSICNFNFDFRVYKSQGVCFSPYSCFADNYCNEEGGKKVMLMCKVLFDTYSKFGRNVLIKSQDDVFYPEYKITYRD